MAPPLGPTPALWPHGADDFVVDELPLYPPSGAGEHVFVRIEKRDLAAGALLAAVARQLGLTAAEVGCAGLKDTHATCRQWLSVPAAALAARGLSPESWPGSPPDPRVRLLEVHRHRHRLRTGHLAGNRFSLRLRGLPPAADAALAEALEHLGRRGMPNFFGPQRFGIGGSTARDGRALLAAAAAGQSPRRLAPWRRRLALSAVQAEAFNAVLARRVAAGSHAAVGPGDVLRVTASGGLFASEDRALEEERLARGEIAVAGPLFGPAMVPTSGEALAVEEEVLAELGLARADFTRFPRLTQGARRPLTVRPSERWAGRGDDGEMRIDFSLPPGSYASVLLWLLGVPAPPERRRSQSAPPPAKQGEV